jgi:hypothetical protein
MFPTPNGGPTLMGLPAVLVAVSMGVTVPDFVFNTYAVGAAVAVAMRRRYASATADAEGASAHEVTDHQHDDPAAAHSEVNGRVATPGS